MSTHYFFSSGHQATIPSIRFEAAFVGLPGDMNNVYLPGKTNERTQKFSWLVKFSLVARHFLVFIVRNFYFAQHICL